MPQHPGSRNNRNAVWLTHNSPYLLLMTIFLSGTGFLS